MQLIVSCSQILSFLFLLLFLIIIFCLAGTNSHEGVCFKLSMSGHLCALYKGCHVCINFPLVAVIGQTKLLSPEKMKHSIKLVDDQMNWCDSAMEVMVHSNLYHLNLGSCEVFNKV